MLETDFETAEGAVRVIDFMPRRGEGPPRLMRIVEGLRGPRPDADGAVAAPGLRRRSCRGSSPRRTGRSRPPARTRSGSARRCRCEVEDGTVRAEFVAVEGARERLTLTWHLSYEEAPAGRGRRLGARPHGGVVARVERALPLRGRVSRRGADLADRAQGDDVRDDRRGDRGADDLAAGGHRRRAQLGLPLLLAARLGARARGAARRGLHRRGAGLPRLPAARRHRRPGDDPDHVRDRRRAAPDRVRARRTCPATRARRPVRVGNAASEQFQLDVYGEVAGGHVHRRRGCSGRIEPRLWPRWRAVVEHVETIWREPDDGIWEARGPQRHYTYSKVMAWVVFDRAVRLAERFELDAPLDRWKQIRDEIHREVCEQGYDRERRTFTQYYGSKELDASVLNIPLVGFLPGDRRARHRHDRRGLARARARRLRLALLDRRDRRRPGGRRGAVPRLLVLARQRARAQRPRRRGAHAVRAAARPGATTSACSPRSTTSARRRQVGNFPQAFSHLTLIVAARDISNAPSVHERLEGDQGAADRLPPPAACRSARQGLIRTGARARNP